MPRKSNIVVELESKLAETTNDLVEIQDTVTTLTERLKQLEEQKISLQYAAQNYQHLLSVAKSTRIRQPRAKKPTATEVAPVAPVPDVEEVRDVC